MSITVSHWDDPISWNDFTASVPQPHFQQSWQWGDLAPQLGGRAVRLAAVRGGVIVGAMQVFVNPIRGTRRTHMYVPRGPAVREPGVQILGPLLDHVRALGEEVDAIGIRLEPNAPACNPYWKHTFQNLGLRPTYPPSQPRSSWLLDISPGEDQFLGAMKQKTRYNIRLAARKGVEVREGSSADLDDFYTLFEETARRDDFFIHDRGLYAHMFGLFWEAGCFRLLLARHRGKLIGAITLVYFGDTCWYLHGASSNHHRNLMATYLLQWEGMRWAKSNGCTLYDFRAVPDVLREDQDMYGVYRFKEGFGGSHFTTLHTYGAAYQPWEYGLWQLYFAGRFKFDNWRRRRRGLPIRQFA